MNKERRKTCKTSPSVASKKRFRKKGKKLVLQNGVEIVFDHTISQVVAFDKALVVRLLWEENSKGDDGGSEVIGVDAKNGKILWNLKRKPDDPFVELYPFDEETVRVFSWRGTILDLYPTTGVVQGKYWTK